MESKISVLQVKHETESKKDRTNIFRVCMFSYCPFIPNTSVVSGYVGLTSFYESLWPDSLSTPSWKATGCSLRDRFLRDTSRLFEGRCENGAELIWLQSKHTHVQGTQGKAKRDTSPKRSERAEPYASNMT